MPVKYYNIQDDYRLYPDAWLYAVWSARGPGKTYSTLADCIEDIEGNSKRFIFIKRTLGDIELMCSRFDNDSDISPFNPLNRDKGWDIYPVFIDKKNGLAAFYHCTINEDGKPEPYGNLLGWIIAASVAPKYKGFNMDADIIIFDEFIPKPWERVNHNEGDAILDFYMTVKRDRAKRGKKTILVLLANATSLTSPLFRSLRLIDIAAEMDIKGIEYTYLPTGVMLHQLPSGVYNAASDNNEVVGIEAHMKDTAWGQMAFGGHFGYNDLTCIGKVNLKGYVPIASYSYNGQDSYIYRKDGRYYICHSKAKCRKHYNLSRESEQKLFYADYVLTIRDAGIEDKVVYESYSDYDLINNYRKVFTL